MITPFGWMLHSSLLHSFLQALTPTSKVTEGQWRCLNWTANQHNSAVVRLIWTTIPGKIHQNLFTGRNKTCPKDTLSWADSDVLWEISFYICTAMKYLSGGADGKTSVHCKDDRAWLAVIDACILLCCDLHTHTVFWPDNQFYLRFFLQSDVHPPVARKSPLLHGVMSEVIVISENLHKYKGRGSEFTCSSRMARCSPRHSYANKQSCSVCSKKSWKTDTYIRISVGHYVPVFKKRNGPLLHDGTCKNVSNSSI